LFALLEEKNFIKKSNNKIVMKLKQLIKKVYSNPGVTIEKYRCPFCTKIVNAEYLICCNIYLARNYIKYVSSNFDYEILFYKDYFEILHLDGKDYPKTKFDDYKLIGNTKNSLESLLDKYSESILFF
jgi:hypothetical protein